MNRKMMASLGITHVLICAQELEARHPNRFAYKQLKLADNPGQVLGKEMADGIKFIRDAREANGKVLLHCGAGQSRSASVMIGYIMHDKEIGYEDAVQQVLDVRPTVDPNIGFVGQLEEFEASGWNLDVLERKSGFGLRREACVEKKDMRGAIQKGKMT